MAAAADRELVLTGKSGSADDPRQDVELDEQQQWRP
jgi:hypothetical protein